MKSFGNIVTPYKKAKYDIALNVCTSIEEIDPSVPTLIVGLERARSTIKGFNILKKHYPDQNIWWTYLRTERGDEYETDLESFYKTLLSEATGQHEYRFVDVLRLGYTQTKKLLKYIRGGAPKWWFNDRGVFLFLYDRNHKVVYGLSLSTCRYCGINPDKILWRISSNPANISLKGFKSIPYSIRRRYGDALDNYFPLLEYFRC